MKKLSLPSLNQQFESSEITMALTEAGLLVDRSETVVQIYESCHNWDATKQQWHDSRMHERGSRASAQRIFRIIKRRLQAGSAQLPSVSELHELLQQSPTERAKAQLFYFYLIREDNLFRYVLRETLRQQGVERNQWDFAPSTIQRMLERFRYEDGSSLGYADSTLERWVQGFRSVLRDIGVINGPYEDKGSTPTIDFPPLHVGALYSWSVEGKGWPERPVGWTYLFQSHANREVLLSRLRASDRWVVSQLRGQTVWAPADSGSYVS